MTGRPEDGRALRDLLLDAVPPLAAPPDRLARVAGIVRRRRRRRTAGAVLGAALAVAGVVLGVGLLPGPSVRVVPSTGTVPAPSAPATGPTGTAPAPSAPATGPTGGSAASGTGGPGTGGRTGAATPAPLPGPVVDLARVPAGDPGSDRRRVVPTTDRPDPGDGTGIFRTVCRYSHMNTDDVAAGASGRGAVPLRTYWGNTAAAAGPGGPWSAVGRSTCRGGVVDRSVQWTPSVVDTRTGTPVAPEAVHVYYASGYQGVRPDQVRPLPAGLTVVGATGTAGTRTAWWACLAGGPRRAGIPDCGGGEVELTVVLPQCWDGRRLDSPGHRAHLAYPDGGCPASHPVALPEISFHVVYRPARAGDPAAWRLSTDRDGAPSGSSATGGWIDGWEPGIARAWTEHCVRAAVSCKSHLLGDGRALEGDA